MAGTGIQLIGEWQKASSMFSRIMQTGRIRREMDAEMKDFADETTAQIKAYIESHPGPALAPYTVAKKGHARILIDTGKYIGSIKTEKVGEMEYFSGALSSDSHERLSMSTLAEYLEYGTSRMPARPHFRPVAARRRREFRKYFNAAKLKQMLGVEGW